MNSLVLVMALIGIALTVAIRVIPLGRRPDALLQRPARKTLDRPVLGIAGMLVVLLSWQLASVLAADSWLVPSPLATLGAFWELVATGQLWPHLVASLLRIGFGFLIAGAIGLALGALAGTFPPAGWLLLPVNSALRYIPPTAFLGLTIVYFGIYEGSKIALISLAIVFYVLQMSADAARRVSRRYVEAAVTLGATPWETFSKVVFPVALPDFVEVLRVNFGAAWTFLVVAEIVSAQRGLGYLMAVSQRFLQIPRLFALIALFGVLGFVTDSLFAILARHVGRWR